MSKKTTKKGEKEKKGKRRERSNKGNMFTMMQDNVFYFLKMSPSSLSLVLVSTLPVGFFNQASSMLHVSLDRS